MEEKAKQFDYRVERSPVWQLNHTGQLIGKSELLGVIKRAYDVSVSNGGAFDPTILPLTSLWKIESGEELVPAAAVLGIEDGIRFLENQPDVEGLIIQERNGKLEANETSGFPIKLKDLNLN